MGPNHDSYFYEAMKGTKFFQTTQEVKEDIKKAKEKRKTGHTGRWGRWHGNVLLAPSDKNKRQYTFSW